MGHIFGPTPTVITTRKASAFCGIIGMIVAPGEAITVPLFDGYFSGYLPYSDIRRMPPSNNKHDIAKNTIKPKK